MDQVIEKVKNHRVFRGTGVSAERPYEEGNPK